MATVDMFCDICRLCGNQQRDNFNIFGNEGKKRNIQDKIKMKIDIDVTRDDPLPKVVCRVCYERLELFTRFQDKCHETQNTLMNIFLSSVEASTSDDGGVNIIHKANVVPKVVYFHADATSSRPTSDDKLAAGIEVKMDPEIADESQPGSDLLHFFTTDSQSESVDIGPCEYPTDAISVVKLETMLPSQTTQKASITYVIVTKEGGQDLIVPVRENPPNKVPIPRLTKYNRADPAVHTMPICVTVQPPCDESVANNTEQSQPIAERASNKARSSSKRRSTFKRLATNDRQETGEVGEQVAGPSKTRKKITRIPASKGVRTNVLKVAGGEFRCKLCGASFPHNYLCEYHVRIHLGEMPFTCETCGKSFAAMYMLRRHEPVHVATGLHLCNTCGRRFRSASNLKAHQLIHVNAPPPYVCPTCDKGFYFRSSYLGHVETHGERLQFVCEVCGKCYKSGRHLKEHVARIHEGVKRYSCPTCEKSFYRQTTYKQHLRLHTDERPHKCDKCGRAFNERTNLVRHLKTHDKPKVKLYVDEAEAFMQELVYS